MAQVENHLIARLPRKDRQRLLSIAEQVDLAQSEVLSEAGDRLRFVYFPIESFISLMTSIDGKPVIEVGMVGSEGMFGAQVTLGVLTQPLYALVQGAGAAWRVPIGAFRKELTRNVALECSIHRYVCVLMQQLAASAACLRFHEITPRLSRWLLMMMQDRAHADTFAVTQEILGFMLGVRRVSITTAASALQRRGLIKYRRGQVIVLNRRGLEAAACGCYAADTEAYAALLG